jgi:excisionase family DNA binding protein
MADAAIPRLISAQDVAAATGLTVYRVYELAREGRLPHRRLGRQVWFVAEEVSAFLTGKSGVATAAVG